MSINQKYIIVKDRAEIYKDFTLNLLYCIFDFYLDRQTLSEDTDIYNHFNWCFNRVCDVYKKEEIDFSKNEDLKNYFYSYYYQQFYKPNIDEISEMPPLSYYEKFWKNIFEIDKQKNKNIVKVLIETYNIFDKSINQEKNILEIV